MEYALIALGAFVVGAVVGYVGCLIWMSPFWAPDEGG